MQTEFITSIAARDCYDACGIVVASGGPDH